MKILVTGAGGNAGQAVCRKIAASGFALKMADTVPPPADVLALGEFIRCDTRTPADTARAVEGADAVIHLAAWHSGHHPAVSDETIFAVNVDGTFNLLQACRAQGVKGLVFASSMAYGWGSVYSVTKVIGEELCRSFHEITRAPVVMLRYHAFVPGPYLDYGARLLRNGVDRQDVASATVASVRAVLSKEVGLFRTIVHTQHGMPAEVASDFRSKGPDWCEEQLPGARGLLEKYNLSLPERVEQHDLSNAWSVLGWAPDISFLSFLRDLKNRDARGEDVAKIRVPGELPQSAS